MLKAKIAVSHSCYRNLWMDYVGEDNPVRVIEAFIDALDLGELVNGGEKLCQVAA